MRFDFDGVREWRVEQIRSDMVVIYKAKTVEAGGLIFVGFDAATMIEQPAPDDFRAAAPVSLPTRFALGLVRSGDIPERGRGPGAL